MAEASHSPGIWQQWQEKIGQMSLMRKIAAVLLLIAVLLTLFFVGQALLRPQYAPLFADLEPEDAGRISRKLQDMGIDYKLGQEGRSILVPENRVYELRIQLASEGILLGSGAGFELFDQTKLGVTDFSQRMDYQRALQEELRRTIVQLDEVEQARVHLALPEPSLFIRDSAAPSASIVLKMRPYALLDQAQVRGIMQLVAGSVENLKVEDVTIIDTKGNLLSDAGLDDPAGQAAHATGKQFAVRREFEAELESRLQRLLDRVLGPGQSIAMVTAELDFDSQETTMITFGTEGVPRSQAVTRETWESSGGVQPGEAGTDSNIPGYVIDSAQGEVSYERTDETINYELDETTEKQIMAPGRLQRLHTAVVLNTRAGQLKQEQIEQIEQTVAAAIGYQYERGDSISVSGMNFDTSLAEEAEREFAAAEQRERLRQYITMGVYALAALLVLIFGLRLLAGRRKRVPDSEPLELPQVPVPAEEEDDLVAIEATSAESRLRKRVRQLAEKEPEAAAFLIRAWLTEE
ncbi:MAG TPA: flagellar M-ring protein FliF [Firmicutes bacterium]|nr:flagellar M-ring protein FliF [Bacillota bacterium]